MGLIFHHDGPFGLQRQIKGIPPLRGKTQTFISPPLGFQLVELVVRIGIQISILPAKLTIDLSFLDRLGDPTERFFIGFEI
ncbi:hypothetical protein D3C76_1614630 [compost metagenome]